MVRPTFTRSVRVFLMAGLLFGAAAAPARAVDGPPLDSQLNVSLVGLLTSPSVVDTVSVSGTHAYLTDDTGLYVVNVANPASPAVVGQLATGSAWDSLVVGSYVYLATADSGLLIVDVTDPANPVQIGRFATRGWAKAVAVAGDRAYILEDEFLTSTRTLRVLDVTDRTAPVQLGQIAVDGTVGNLTVAGNLVYVATLSDLEIFDVTDPAAPVKVGSFPAFARDVQVIWNTAYLVGGGTLWILDVSDPAAPALIGSYTELDDPQQVSVAWPYAYIADWDSGVRVLDISVKSHPILVGYYEESVSWVTGVVAAGGYIYESQGFSTPDGGFRILRLARLVTTVSPPVDLYLHTDDPTPGAALGNAFFDSNPPTASGVLAAKYYDSAPLHFSDGNPWMYAANWQGKPLTADALMYNLTSLKIWLGLSNTADVGARFDIRVEVHHFGRFGLGLLATGETRCIGGLTTNPYWARQTAVRLARFDRFKMLADDTILVLVFARMGTWSSGASCGGLSSASAVRLYFDSTARPSRFGYQLSVISPLG